MAAEHLHQKRQIGLSETVNDSTHFQKQTADTSLGTDVNDTPDTLGLLDQYEAEDKWLHATPRSC